MKSFFTLCFLGLFLVACKPSPPLPPHLQKLELERGNLFDEKTFVSEDAFYYLQSDWDYSRSPICYPVGITSVLRGRLSLTWKTANIVDHVDRIGYGHGFVFGEGIYENYTDHKIFLVQD